MYVTEDSIKIESFTVPRTLKPTDVLIETHFASINELDYAHVLNHYDVKFGRDFSGIVKDVGEDVDNFKKGDLVYGHQLRAGAVSQYIIIPNDQIRKIPKDIDLEIASFLPFGAFFAYQAFELNNLEIIRGCIKNPLLCNILQQCSKAKKISLDFDALRTTNDSMRKCSIKKIREFLSNPETYNQLMSWIDLHAEWFKDIVIFQESLINTPEQLKGVMSDFRKYEATGPFIVPIKKDFLAVMEEYILIRGKCIHDEGEKEVKKEKKRQRVPTLPPMRLLSPCMSLAIQSANLNGKKQKQGPS